MDVTCPKAQELRVWLPGDELWKGDWIRRARNLSTTNGFIDE